MKFSLHNIGKVAQADIEIKGIATIAGENDTGKSTVGKALYAVFNSLHNSTGQIERDRRQSIESAMWRMAHSPASGIESLRIGFTEEDVDLVLEAGTDFNNMRKTISRIFSDFHLSEEALKTLSSDLVNLASISDDIAFLDVLSNNLSREFNGQVNNLFVSKESSKGSISLSIKEKQFIAEVKDDAASFASNRFDLRTQAVYLDDPLVLDDASHMMFRVLLDFRVSTIGTG